MGRASDDLHDKHGKVEGCIDLGGRPGYELQAPDGERREGMVWFSFRSLDETFGLEHNGEGCWMERYLYTQRCNWGKLTQFKPGHKHTEESKRRMSESHSGKVLTEQHKQRVSQALGRTITYKGKEYHSIREAARQTGDSYGRVRNSL